MGDIEACAAKHCRRLKYDVLLPSPKEPEKQEIDDHRRQRDVQEHVRRSPRCAAELRRVPEG
jgi:hypothetical protein